MCTSCYEEPLYEESPSEGWVRWAINQIESAEFVLVICTQQYSQLFSGKEAAFVGLHFDEYHAAI